MKGFVVTNLQKKESTAIRASLLALSRQHGLALVEATEEDSHAAFPEITPAETNALAECDVIISIGGDGTIMHCAKLGATTGKPVVGINAGKLGFLTQIEPARLEQCLLRLISGDYTVEYRSAIAATFQDDLCRPITFAINDIVIAKAPEHNMARFVMCCNDRPIDSYRADGLIFSTSTGSTAYNLSAGGPVIDPLLSAVTLVPICPHSLSVRPLVFSEDRVITVCCEETPLVVIADGSSRRTVAPGTSIQIRTATKRAGFITFHEQEFFEILTKKIKQRG